MIANPATLGLGERLRGEAGRAGADAVLALMAERATHAGEPPAPVAAAMAAADVVLAPTVQSLSHTAARKAASEAGARIATLPGVTEEMLARVMSADMAELRRRGNAIADALNAGTEARITCANGSDLRIGLEGRTAIPDAGELTAPRRLRQPALRRGLHLARRRHLRGHARGRRDDRRRRHPRRAGPADGRGRPPRPPPSGPRAQALLDLLDRPRPEATTIAELGIGTNERAKLTGNVLEDEKLLGTAHVAFGASEAIGGRIQVPVHLDCVVMRPTVSIDGDRDRARRGAAALSIARPLPPARGPERLRGPPTTRSIGADRRGSRRRPGRAPRPHSDAVHNRTVFTLAGGRRAARPRAHAASPRARSSDRHHPPAGRASADRRARRLPGRLAEARAPRQRARAGARGRASSSPRSACRSSSTGSSRARAERRERAFFRRGGPESLAGGCGGELEPDLGPGRPHPTAGGVLVTARPPLAAFNVELEGADRATRARRSRRSCASPAAARPACGRSRSSSARAGCRSRPTSTTRGRAARPASSSEIRRARPRARRRAGRGGARRARPGRRARRLPGGRADHRRRPAPADDRGAPRLDSSATDLDVTARSS